MSLHQKDRGYSFYDAMNSRLSFMYFSRNGGIRDVFHSVVTFFFFCGKKHILHILHLPPPTQRPKCNVLELRYGRISPEATSNSSSLFLFAVFLCYYRQNSCIIHSMDYMIVISRLFINLMTFFPTISFYGSLGNIWPYTVDLFRC